MPMKGRMFINLHGGASKISNNLGDLATVI